MASVRFYDRNDHCIAVIQFAMPVVGGHASVCGVGDTKVEALARAASIASRIADDPVMRAIMPPQAQAAIVAAKGLAAAARRGLPVLKSFWGRIKGPGKKRLAAALIHDEEKQVTGDIGWNPFKKKKKPQRARAARGVMPPPRAMPEEPDDSPDADDVEEDAA